MINKRLFGAPIPPLVKKKLEDRQKVAGQLEFGDSIEAVYPDKDGKNQADLSSRTPFVRMWTSVKLFNPANLEDILEEITEEEFENFQTEVNNPGTNKKYDKLIKQYPDLAVIRIGDRGNRPNLDGKYFLVTGEAGSSVFFDTRDQVDYTEKTYIIGDYNYQSNYGEVQPGESLSEGALPNLQTEDTNDTVSGNSPLYEIFPSELEKNPLLKPQSGITSITSETEGTLGIIKKTTVNFIVHNFYDYDRIFNKYFLKPGATVFVDFGWSSVKSLYNPDELIAKSKEKGIEHYLYAENKIDGEDGEITKNKGDLEVLQGIVTDYSSKITQNGSVECSVTLTSSNSSLLDLEATDDVQMRIKALLERGILFLGVQEIIDGNSEVGNDLQQLLNTPDYDSDAIDIQTYNKNLQNLAVRLLTSSIGKPNGNAVRTGVYLNDLSMDDTYISFGLFEDLIINSQFGFGKSVEDINQGGNSQVRINSSNSYTVWSEKFSNAQRIMFTAPEDPPKFLYPAWWADSEEPSSYTFQKGKIPDEPNLDFGTFTNKTEYDISLKRIPLREIFVNTEIIVNAFNTEKNIKKVLKKIIDDINDASSNILKLELTRGDNESEIKIIDKNYTDFDEKDQIIKDTNDNFVFNVMNPNSIVKDYNLEFKLPTGNIGNMYAIQGASHGDNIFSINSDVVDSLNLNKVDKESLSIIYNPDLGTFRLKQLLDTHSDADFFNVYNQVNKLMDSNIYNVNTVSPKYYNKAEEDSGLIEGESTTQMYSSDATPTSKNNNEGKLNEPPTLEDLIAQNEESLESVGVKVAKTFREYFGYQITNEVTRKTPALLPYTLNLTTYGISTVQPGDTFQVDYLPRMYLENTYLQITKVTHNVGPSGWYTSFDTQFRLKSTEANTHEINTDIRLSANAILNLGLQESFQIDNGTFLGQQREGDPVPIKKLFAYCTNFQILNRDDPGIDMMVKFRTTKKLKEAMGTEKTTINHRYDQSLYGTGKGNYGLKAKFRNEEEFLNSLNKYRITSDDGKRYIKLEESDFNHRQGPVRADAAAGSRAGIYSRTGAEGYERLVEFANIELNASTEYLLVTLGDQIAIIDPSKISVEKLGIFLQWWGEYGGYDYNNQPIEPEAEEEVEKLEVQYRLSASPTYAPDGINDSGGGGDIGIDEDIIPF
tara:strand:- start:64 stop:3552 length:3489 start_codon:yes stop_codon:yes gene_type:complete